MKTALLALAIISVAGCSFGVFSDLGDKAPAARVDQDDSDISSSSFGDHLAGVPRWKENGTQPGGLLAVTGNGNAALATVTVAGDGKVSIGHAEKDDIKANLDDPNRITAMAPAPSDRKPGSADPPFVYLARTSGDVGTVKVVAASNFSAIQTFAAPKNVLPVAEFGLALAPANLGDQGTVDDLAVGAKDALVLLRTDHTLGWPAMQDGNAVTVADPGQATWPSGGFSVIAAGNLDTSTPEDEIVAAIPEKNTVVVIHHTEDCFKDTTVACATYIRIRESGANRFGSALLVADVDNDSKLELLVGASDVDKVYVYDLEPTHFDPANKEPTLSPTVLKTPTGANEFGASLAHGKVDGGAKPLLAVGAPGSEVSGKSSAGRIHLFDSSFNEVGTGIELATPEDKTLLGRQLAIVPYAKEGEAPKDVLAASGRDAVFLFFANLTPGHKDFRN